MDAKKLTTAQTARVRVDPAAELRNTTLVLTRQVGQRIAFWLDFNDYMVVTVTQESKDQFGLQLMFNPDKETEYEKRTQIARLTICPKQNARTKTGGRALQFQDNQESIVIPAIEVVLRYSSTIKLGVLPDKYSDIEVRVVCSLPAAVKAHRWELLDSRDPDLAERIRRDHPQLFI
jgi:hypothetical protein